QQINLRPQVFVTIGRRRAGQFDEILDHERHLLQRAPTVRTAALYLAALVDDDGVVRHRRRRAPRRVALLDYVAEGVGLLRDGDFAAEFLQQPRQEFHRHDVEARRAVQQFTPLLGRALDADVRLTLQVRPGGDLRVPGFL